MNSKILTAEPNALADRNDLDIISVTEAGTLAGLFRQRVKRSPDKPAYREFERPDKKWHTYTWQQMSQEVARWQQALLKEDLKRGDRVAIWLPNGRSWVAFDQAALGLGLVVVPVYVDDHAENVAYMLKHSGASLLFLGKYSQWRSLSVVNGKIDGLQRIVLMEYVVTQDEKIITCKDWLPAGGFDLISEQVGPDDLASIVYTSGTTGRPKGVMLSHSNILENCYMGLRSIAVSPKDLFLSFLPLSHTLERTVGYYLPMMAGAEVAYARSIRKLADDLAIVRPTLIVSVPRIFERIYQRVRFRLQSTSLLKKLLLVQTLHIGWKRFLYYQGRGFSSPSLLLWPLLNRFVARKITAKLGGRLRGAISGGAPLPFAVGQFFLSLGVPVMQGYGLTESSPILTVNTFSDNIPESIGIPLYGVELKIGKNGELLARGKNIMLGYWNNLKATVEVLDNKGWLSTGDCARFEGKHVFITGRIKEILVLSNGEKVPPADIESAISADQLFEQIMVLGEGRPFLSALVVVNNKAWLELAAQLSVETTVDSLVKDKRVAKELLSRIATLTRDFPGYAEIYRVAPMLEPWTIENGLLTPTLKLKRQLILEKYKETIAQLYVGH